MTGASTCPYDVVVVGAGLSGLSAAWQAHQTGQRVLVLEAGAQAGGLIRSDIHADCLLEAGPHTFPSTAVDINALCRAVGLSPQPAHPMARKRYLFVGGRLLALPQNPWQAITTPLLSAQAKWQILNEAARPRFPQTDGSIAAFFNHRFHPEISQRLIDPLISGIYAGDIQQLSMPAVFPKLWGWEQASGSLLRGAWQARRQRRTQESPRPPRYQLLSLPGGLGQLTQALVRALPTDSIRYNAPVHTLEATEHGYHLRDVHGQSIPARAVILATPAPVASRLLATLSPAASRALADIPYQGLTVAHTALDRTQIAHPLDGFGCLIPRQEALTLLGSIWVSSLFPDRVPAGTLLLSNFFGGAHHPEHAHWNDAQVQTEVLRNLQIVFRNPTPLAPQWIRIHRHPQAIPQYTLGHLQRIAQLQTAMQALPGVRLCGNYLHGIALNECVKSGQQAARAILQ